MVQNESERNAKCEEQYKTELEDVMEQYRKERNDFDRRLKDRNRIGKKYLELEKKVFNRFFKSEVFNAHRSMKKH